MPDSPSAVTTIARMTAAADRMTRLATAIDDGRPWPSGPVTGDGPESAWGPPEVLAHVAEMLDYWQVQMELVRVANAGGATEPPTMGRAGDDPGRVEGIEAGRLRSTTELLAGIDGSIARYATWLPGLSSTDWQATGRHPRRGLMTVAEMLELLVVGHLDEHATQLAATLGREP